MEREEGYEHGRRKDAEPELTRPSDVLIDYEAAEGPGGDDGDRREREAAHHVYLRRPGGRRFDRGIARTGSAADAPSMIWPVAALAVFLLGFVVVYGSRLQARVEASVGGRAHEDSGVDLDIV